MSADPRPPPQPVASPHPSSPPPRKLCGPTFSALRVVRLSSSTGFASSKRAIFREGQTHRPQMTVRETSLPRARSGPPRQTRCALRAPGGSDFAPAGAREPAPPPPRPRPRAPPDLRPGARPAASPAAAPPPHNGRGPPHRAQGSRPRALPAPTRRLPGPGPSPTLHVPVAAPLTRGRERRSQPLWSRPHRRSDGGAGGRRAGTTFSPAEGLLRGGIGVAARTAWRRRRRARGRGTPARSGLGAAYTLRSPAPSPRPAPRAPRPAMAEPSPARRPVPLIESGKTRRPRPPRGAPSPAPAPSPPPRPRLTRLPVFPQSCTSSSPGTYRPARVGEPPR